MSPTALRPAAGRAPGPAALPAPPPAAALPTAFAVRSAGPLLGRRPADLAGHLAAHGPRPAATGRAGDALLAALDAVALTGRGGAHVLAATKWRAALAAGGAGTVVANAAEGEPASAKDAALLRYSPHLVLDGLQLAAEATGASRCVLWLHADAVESRRAVSRALAERRTHAGAGAGAGTGAGPGVGPVTWVGARPGVGPAGGTPPGLPPDIPVEVRDAPPTYLAGESSAVLRALAGGPALPRFRPVRGAATGPDGRPALVHNAETLARVALLARTGPDRWPGGALLTVVAAGRRTVVEVPGGTSLAAAVAAGTPPEEPGGVGGRQPAAVLLGGYGGAWAAWADVAGLSVDEGALRRPASRPGAGLSPTPGLPWGPELPGDEQTLQAARLSLGAGVIVPLPPGACGLAATARLLAYLAASGARQCGPCLFGLPALADLAARLAAGRARRGDVDRLRRYAADVTGRGACGHPDGAVRMLVSALAVFAADVAAHASGRPCGGAGVALPGADGPGTDGLRALTPVPGAGARPVAPAGGR